MAGVLIHYARASGTWIGRRWGWIALAALLSAAAALAVAKWSKPKNQEALLAYIASGGNNHVQVIDLTTGKTLRKIYTGATPWKLVLAPDKKSLWIQHWYAGNTVVVDLATHEVRGSFPARGPGAFTASGTEFLTFDWPSSSLRSVAAKNLELLKEEATEVRQVYDVAPDPSGQRLLLVQYDPMAKGPRERYSYVLGYSHGGANTSAAAPTSYRTGRSPVRIRTVASGDFAITADHETNGLTLVNKLGDTRSISTCRAPNELLISPDQKRMIVACSPADGSTSSRLVSYRTDFGARPWPVIKKEASSEFRGTLAAGAFSPAGDRVYLVDRTSAQLVELKPEGLRPIRSFPTGDVPLDVVVLEASKDVRRQLSREGSARSRLRAILSRMLARSQPARELSWTESVRSAAEQRSKDSEQSGARTVSATEPRRLKVAFRAPNSLRIEAVDGNVRLAEGGHALSVEPDGRFWVAPRQDLMGALLSITSSNVEQAISELAGDVPGSPYLRGGIAVDLLSEIREGTDRYVLIGALSAGWRVSQLWVDADSGRPTNLIEQFPTFASNAHRPAGFGGLVETKFYDFTKTAAGTELPTRLERVIDGRVHQHVRLEDVRDKSGLAPGMFELARLGGVVPPPTERAPLPAPEKASLNQPGRAVPILSAGYLRRAGERHMPYNSDPPTSGPRLPYLADWGVNKLPVPLELQVHNLEHGGVAIQYNCSNGCADLVTALERIASSRPFVLVAPYPWMDSRVALTAWGRIDTFDELDIGRIERFIKAYAGKDHHSASKASLAAIGH